MKDSGIECIGAIPEHWNVIIGKYLLTNKLINNRRSKNGLFEFNQCTCNRNGGVPNH